MSEPFQYGTKVVFGVKPMMPITNCPEGRQRVRLRNRDVARLFVKTKDGIRHFIIKDCGDHWEPVFEQARNIRQ